MLEPMAFPIPSDSVGRRSKGCYGLCLSACGNICQQCPFWCGGIWPAPTRYRKLGLMWTFMVEMWRLGGGRDHTPALDDLHGGIQMPWKVH